jgi:hypothetical protein
MVIYLEMFTNSPLFNHFIARIFFFFKPYLHMFVLTDLSYYNVSLNRMCLKFLLEAVFFYFNSRYTVSTGRPARKEIVSSNVSSRDSYHLCDATKKRVSLYSKFQ